MDKKREKLEQIYEIYKRMRNRQNIDGGSLSNKIRSSAEKLYEHVNKVSMEAQEAYNHLRNLSDTVYYVSSKVIELGVILEEVVDTEEHAEDVSDESPETVLDYITTIVSESMERQPENVIEKSKDVVEFHYYNPNRFDDYASAGEKAKVVITGIDLDLVKPEMISSFDIGVNVFVHFENETHTAEYVSFEGIDLASEFIENVVIARDADLGFDFRTSSEVQREKDRFFQDILDQGLPDIDVDSNEIEDVEDLQRVLSNLQNSLNIERLGDIFRKSQQKEGEGSVNN